MKFPLTTEEVCALVPGLTPRKCQWYDEKGYFSPRHSRNRREYDKPEVLQLMIYTEMVRRGIRHMVARRVMDRLRKHDPSSPERTRTLSWMAWLVVEAKGSSFAHITESAALDSVKKAGLCIVVDVGEKRKGLDSL